METDHWLQQQLVEIRHGIREQGGLGGQISSEGNPAHRIHFGQFALSEDELGLAHESVGVGIEQEILSEQFHMLDTDDKPKQETEEKTRTQDGFSHLCSSVNAWVQR